MTKHKSNEPSSEPRSRSKWWLRISLLFVCLVVGIAGFVGYSIWGAVSKGQVEQRASKHREKEVDIQKDPFTILFMGVDQYSTKEEAQELRTDVLMVVAINPTTHSVKLVSIPRDTLAEIANTDGYKTKINAAAYWGKQKGYDPLENVRETVENFLGGVPIDYYAKINFKGFIDIVNAVGGVNVNVPLNFKIETFGNKVYKFEKGPAHLTGEQALPYVRMRKKDPEGDFGRQKRQQEVISQILDRIVSFNSLTKVQEISNAVGNNLTYTIPTNEFLSFIEIYQETPKQNIESIQIQTTPRRINGGAYEIISKDERLRISQLMKEHLGIEKKSTVGENLEAPSVQEPEGFHQKN
ncbi:LCP family protein [Risungbinella massiliensis]|uniref:LCP family protein n=1 Tax=Risungbinella massiliensis TaxID=1329796 RepID=UPI00069B3258|nr:LCP family protein [Risungbinella massiliensis]